MKRMRIAWITHPGCISTDWFILPELAKYYDIDWYLIAKENERVDFISEINKAADDGVIRFYDMRFKYRNFMPQMFFEYRNLIKEIKSRRYDIYYTVLMGMPYYMPLWTHIIGNKRTVLAVHNVRVPKGGTYYNFNKVYNKYCLKRYNYFHTFSKDQNEQLLAAVPGKFSEYSGFASMDYGQPKTNRKTDQLTFLNFGLIRDYKRVDTLILAAQRAYEDTKKSFRVIIAGYCEDWKPYEKLIKYPELFDLRIHRIEDEEVADLFNECDYFVAPYQDIAQSGAAVIAVNYGKPVICSKLPAFEEYIRDGYNGYLIRPADVDSLTEMMIRAIYTSSMEYKELSSHMFEIKESSFSPASVSRSYIRTFEVFNDTV